MEKGPGAADGLVDTSEAILGQDLLWVSNKLTRKVQEHDWALLLLPIC